MSTVGQFVTSADKTKIWADQAGDASKPAVVFIPGLSCIALAFEKQWSDPSMLSNLHLVRYDVRGQGQSDKPLGADSYISIRLAEDFKAVCDAFNLKKPFVAGWSMGASVPADIAALYGPGFMSGVILLGGSPYRRVRRDLDPLLARTITPFLSNDVAEWSGGVAAFVDSCVAYPEKMPQATRYAWIGGAAQEHPFTRRAYLSRTQDEAKLLEAKSTLPFLVLAGAKDSHVDARKLADFMRRSFDNVEIHIFDQTGHSVFYEKPEDTNKAILNFVKRVALKA